MVKELKKINNSIQIIVYNKTYEIYDEIKNI